MKKLIISIFSFVSVALAVVALFVVLIWRSGTVETNPTPDNAIPPELSPTSTEMRRSSEDSLASVTQQEEKERLGKKRNGGEKKTSGIVARAPAGYVQKSVARQSPEAHTPERIATAVDQVIGDVPAKSSERFRAVALLKGHDLPEDATVRLL